MKKIILSILLIFIFPEYTAFASTIITSPIDSRPISTDYLENLTAIAGDRLISVNKENLDFYSAVDKNNYKGDSESVRRELRDIVSLHSNEDTSVIINTSTYLTNGLVSSRCGINYRDITSGLNDLYELITQFPEPTYYVNLAMPRTLPETRLNRIWRDNEKQYGLGFFYLKHNPDTPLKSYIVKNLRRVTPSQYLLEYGYVLNKKAELGHEALTKWESEFLESFKYEVTEPYKSDIYNYKLPFKSVSEIFTKLLRWQDEGLIDEIIISCDDFQLPDFIIYLFNNSQEEITVSNNTPVKFSYARTYMSANLLSLTNQLTLKRGAEETKKALSCRNKNVNFIFGMDEVPQLIYARDLSKRKNMTADFHTIFSGKQNNIAKFDVLSVYELLENDINFVSYGAKKTDKKMDFYLYDYNDATFQKTEKTHLEIKNSLEQGNLASLVEIYSEQLLNTGENLLFQSLVKDGTIASLSSYSAWNTNQNAIGLGVAHAGVSSIARQLSLNSLDFQRAQTKMLIQHVLEDGVYTIQTKRALSNERYIPSEQDLIKSQKLYDSLKPEPILDIFSEQSGFDVRLKTYTFPWARTFECFLDFDIL